MALLDLFSKHINQYCTDLILILGSIKVFFWGKNLLASFWRHAIRPCFQSHGRLYQKYGALKQESQLLQEASWAVVTGGSDGIGLGMCKKLAREGFNICIVARNQQKMDQKLQEIRNECRKDDNNFKTMSIVADFVQLRSIQEYREVVAEKLKDVDVGILVLNAGYALGGPFAQLTDLEIEKHIQVNANHVVYLAKAMLDQLVQRYDKSQKKSAVVIVSSILSMLPMSGVTCYCATKTFASYVGEALNVEYKDKVDIMAYEPGEVATKMVNKTQGGGFTIMPSKSADACFRDIGIRQVTRGAWRHEYIAWIFSCIPRYPLQCMAAKEASKNLEKDRARHQVIFEKENKND